MSQPSIAIGMPDRLGMVRRGRRLEYFTVIYNSLEGLIAIIAGWMAGSIALTGFGFDSVIEVTSGAVLLWRLHADGDEARRKRAEELSLRIVGGCFLALTLYVSYESVLMLARHEPPARSLPGIALAMVSLVVMPLLSRAKRKVARQIGSQAMSADAKQTQFCTCLSAILLGGLLLNALEGWWWADPIAGLVMAPIIAKEGLGTLRGEACCHGRCPER